MRTFQFFFAAILGLAAVSTSAPTTLEKREAHPLAVKAATAVPDTVGCSFKNKRGASVESATSCDNNE